MTIACAREAATLSRFRPEQEVEAARGVLGEMLLDELRVGVVVGDDQDVVEREERLAAIALDPGGARERTDVAVTS
jgi:hypothetical protein